MIALVWTREARNDRISIYDYIEAENPEALAVDEMFANRAARLLCHPKLGRPGRLPGTHELVVHRNYVLVYDIAEGELVRALRVLHAARQWPPGQVDPKRPRQ